MSIESNRVKLKDISLDISYGYTASATQIETGVKYLRITDIVGNFVDWDTVPYCEIDENKIEKYKLKKGDLCIARTGNTVGANYVVNEDVDCVFASYLVRFKLDTTKVNPMYIKYVFKSAQWKSYVDKLKTKSVQPGLNAQEMGNFEFLLPGKDEQDEIANNILLLDKKIEVNNILIKNLHRYTQLLFHKYFMSSKLNKVDMKKISLSELVEINTETVKPMDNKDIIYKYYSIPVFDETRCYGEELGSSILSNKYKVRENNILVSKLNPWFKRIVYPIKIDDNTICSTEFVVWTPLKKDILEYLYVIANTERFTTYCSNASIGTSNSHKRINPNFMMKYKVPYNEAKVKEFNKIVKPMIKKIHISLVQNKELLNMRNLLIEDLIN